MINVRGCRSVPSCLLRLGVDDEAPCLPVYLARSPDFRACLYGCQGFRRKDLLKLDSRVVEDVGDGFHLLFCCQAFLFDVVEGLGPGVLSMNSLWYSVAGLLTCYVQTRFSLLFASTFASPESFWVKDSAMMLAALSFSSIGALLGRRALSRCSAETATRSPVVKKDIHTCIMLELSLASSVRDCVLTRGIHFGLG